MHNSPDISIVIGFRDWGLDRLRLSLESLVASGRGINVEVVVCDFSSADGASVESTTVAAGGVYHRVDGERVWSRARALNAGISISTGKFIACTDADMLFSPDVLPVVVEKLSRDRSRYLVLQCQDLPPELDATGIVERFPKQIDWSQLRQVARFRPRWGMGGFIAFPRDDFEMIRGLDERMEIYGGEDIDLANRLTRAGLRLEWLQSDGCDMFHIWHPSSRAAATLDSQGQAALTTNRSIMLNDDSAIRNIREWQFRSSSARPAVTVALATYNRAGVLRDSIDSILSQTMSDFELVIMDDGSDDETQDILSEYSDQRIVSLRQDNCGVATARNSIARQSRGKYTVVQDSDDIMPPWRLEVQLSAIRPGVHGNYGSAVNFDDESGALSLIRCKRFSLPALLFNSQVLLHGTLMLDTALLQRIGYNETLRSGTDYNLAVRLAKLGVNLDHTGQLHLVRRLHGDQLTTQDSRVQVLSSHLTNAVTRAQMGAKQEDYHRRNRNDDLKFEYSDQQMLEQAKPYLPDHLVRRLVTAKKRSFLDDNDIASGSVQGFGARTIAFQGADADTVMFSDIEWAGMAQLSRAYSIDSATVMEGQGRHDSFRSVVRHAVSLAAEHLATGNAEFGDSYLSVWRAETVSSGVVGGVDEMGRFTLSLEPDHYTCVLTSQDVQSVAEVTPLFVLRLFSDATDTTIVSPGVSV